MPSLPLANLSPQAKANQHQQLLLNLKSRFTKNNGQKTTSTGSPLRSTTLYTRLAKISRTMNIRLPSTRRAKSTQPTDPLVHTVTGTALASQPANSNGQFRPSHQPWFKSTTTRRTQLTSKSSNSRTTNTQNGLSSQTAEVTLEKSPWMPTCRTLLWPPASRPSSNTLQPPAKMIERAIVSKLLVDCSPQIISFI